MVPMRDLFRCKARGTTMPTDSVSAGWPSRVIAPCALFLLVLHFSPGETVHAAPAGVGPSRVEVADGDKPPTAGQLFARDNLIAWCIVPFDSKRRGPEERAAMLER